MRAYYNVTQLNCEDVFSLEKVDSGWKVVLPDRFELSTSPLPMECSTPELRQRIVRTYHQNLGEQCHRPDI